MKELNEIKKLQDDLFAALGEVFKPLIEKETEKEFKVGQWVKCTTGLGVIGRIKSQFYKETYKLCETYCYQGVVSVNINRIRLATPEEIKEHLEKEAVRRGFKPGVKIKREFKGDNNYDKISIIQSGENIYYPKQDIYSFCDIDIYFKGQWATIFKEELPKVNGCEIDVDRYGISVWDNINKSSALITFEELDSIIEWRNKTK